MILVLLFRQEWIFFLFFFHHTTCESTCDTLASSVANQGDNTVSVAQGGTATPGATEQLLPPVMILVLQFRQEWKIVISILQLSPLQYIYCLHGIWSLCCEKFFGLFRTNLKICVIILILWTRPSLYFFKCLFLQPRYMTNLSLDCSFSCICFALPNFNL